MDSPRIPWTRASCSGAVIRGGSAPTAGMNTASTTPNTRATGTSSQRLGGISTTDNAAARMTTQRVASEATATRRGPNRSASTPPPSMSTARGNAPVAMTSPACDGPVARVADHERTRKYTTSPMTEAV